MSKFLRSFKDDWLLATWKRDKTRNKSSVWGDTRYGGINVIEISEIGLNSNGS